MKSINLGYLFLMNHIRIRILSATINVYILNKKFIYSKEKFSNKKYYKKKILLYFIRFHKNLFHWF
jgi:hypothetical protein